MQFSFFYILFESTFRKTISCLEFVKVQTKLLTLNMITYDTKSKLRDHAQEKKKVFYMPRPWGHRIMHGLCVAKQALLCDVWFGEYTCGVV